MFVKFSYDIDKLFIFFALQPPDASPSFLPKIPIDF
jgi:hypothetical protein